MKSNVSEIMKQKGITVSDLQDKIQYTITIKKGSNKGETKTVKISTATIMDSRDDKKILNCRLFILSLIAAALNVTVKDLFDEDPGMD